ncbi:MAG: H-type lectin domain-containing protein [Isosphaeraceae bacterium]
MTPFHECQILHYRNPNYAGFPYYDSPSTFQPSCTDGDWVVGAYATEEIVWSIQSPEDWGKPPATFTKGSRPLAFFSGHVHLPMDPNDLIAAAVTIPVQPRYDGVYLRARNTSLLSGKCILRGFGVHETPGQKQKQAFGVRFEQLPPQGFPPNWWYAWKEWPAFPVPGPTDYGATDFLFGALTAQTDGVPNNKLIPKCAPVGVLKYDDAGYRVAALNSDVSGGLSGMNVIVFSNFKSKDQTFQESLWVDTGELPATWPFMPSGLPGDWMPSVHVTFHGAFEERPWVFVSPNAVGVKAHLAAVVPIVDDVSTTGFTLHARNADCSVGMAGFHWVAFGRGRRK